MLEAHLAAAENWVQSTRDDLDAALTRLRKIESTTTHDLADRLAKLEAAATMAAASTSTTTAAPTGVAPLRPKATPPPTFTGDGSKIPVKEWLQKCIMYFSVAKIYQEREQIVEALQRLSGSAFQYQEKRIRDSVDVTKSLGTWKEFEDNMERVYGKKTDQEVARKEIKGYFGDEGKKKAKANFFTYAERLRQLVKAAKSENSTVLEELKDALPEKVRDGFSMLKIIKHPAPTECKKYLDMAIEFYKDAYPDAITGSIFEDGKKETKKVEGSSGGKKAATITTSQTSRSEKTASGGGTKTKKAGQSLPDNARPDASWRVLKDGKRILISPPHKCAQCSRDNCTTGWNDCKWKGQPKGTAPSASKTTAGSSSNTSTTSSRPAPANDGKKRRFVRIIERYETDEEDNDEGQSATASTVGTLTRAHIEEVAGTDSDADKDTVPDTTGVIVHQSILSESLKRLLKKKYTSDFYYDRM